MINPLLRRLATVSAFPGLPAGDGLAVYAALAERDWSYALLTAAFSSLAQAVDAPAGVGASVAAILAVLIAGTTGGDVVTELLRAALPLGVALSLARVSALLAEEEAEVGFDRTTDPTGKDVLVRDSAADYWERRLEERLRRRDAANSALIDELLRSTRGLSAARGEALKRHCSGRDALLLSAAEWERCEGIGLTLAIRIVEGLRQVAKLDEGVRDLNEGVRDLDEAD